MTDAPDSALEQRLRRAAGQIEFPVAPDVADRVIAALQAGPVRRARPWWARPAFALAISALVLSGVALVFSPTAREAVAGWIGLDGVRIEYGDEPERELGTDLQLGDPIPLSGATDAAGFEVRPPAQLGEPDEVYLASSPQLRISLVYRARAGLPKAPTTDVGLLLSAFRARIDHEIIAKKGLGSGTEVEQIAVNGSRGYWINGEPHALYYVDDDGELREDLGRLAGNTLVWQDGDLIYRLESRLSKARALEIASSIP